MQLDSSIYFGYFNFYLGPRYCVDEELYRYIVLSASLQSTTVIANTLKSIAHEAYYGDYQQYLSCVGMKKVTPPKRVRTVERMANAAFQARPRDPLLADLHRKKQECANAVARARLVYAPAKRQAESDIALKDLLTAKQDKNIYGAKNIFK